MTEVEFSQAEVINPDKPCGVCGHAPELHTGEDDEWGCSDCPAEGDPCYLYH